MKNKNSENHSKWFSRRDFLKTSAIALGATGTVSVLSPHQTQAVEKKEDISIAMAGYNTDRVRALINGKVKLEGCNTTFEVMAIGDINSNLFSGPQSLDITEIGLQPFILAYANNGFRDYSLLPIFPLRQFRHKSIFIRTDRGINEPKDLKGKKVATAGYSSTSLTCIRGVLQDEYGVKPQDMEWVISSRDSAAKASGKTSKQENVLPKEVSISKGPEGKDESDLLETGEVDAVFHAVEPKGYIQGHPKIDRLFPDYRATERAYFKKTGIFPIMHAVAIRKTLLKEYPWLMEAAFRMYSQSKQMSYDYMATMAELKDSLPWFGQEFRETRNLMGANYYSYGMMKPNRKALEAMFRYSFEQGLCKKELKIEELFERESLAFVES